jgi:hypothetical protein
VGVGFVFLKNPAVADRHSYCSVTPLSQSQKAQQPTSVLQDSGDSKCNVQNAEEADFCNSAAGL